MIEVNFKARADSCIFAHECSDCRRVARFKVGQNLFRARDNKVLPAEWRYITRSWFSEIELFPGLGSIARYRYTPGTGHYTLMVWSSVSRVGCGYITYANQETAPLVARSVVISLSVTRVSSEGTTCVTTAPGGTSSET